MGDFRARDADRDRTVEVIEAAYVDGQLGEADRELRIGQALAAGTLDELAALTRDLQRPAGTVPGGAVERPTPAPVPGRRTSGPLVPVGALVAVLLLALLAAGVAGLALFVPAGEVEEAVSEDVTQVVVEPTEEPVAEQRARFELTPRDVRAFLRGYEQKFGTSESYDAVLYPTRVRVDVPVRGSRPRAESWSYDGTWRQDSPATAAIRPGGIVDLGAVDVRGLFANIPVAERTLDVPGGEVTHVAVRRNVAGEPTVNIYVSNSFNESGYLMTTMSGEIVRRFRPS